MNEISVKPDDAEREPVPRHYVPDGHTAAACAIDQIERWTYRADNVTCPACLDVLARATDPLVSSSTVFTPPAATDTEPSGDWLPDAELEQRLRESAARIDPPPPLTDAQMDAAITVLAVALDAEPGFADLATPIGPTLPPVGRRTVGLEVATDELRALAVRLARSNIREEMAAAKVALVLRIDGEVRAVPDTDVPWALHTPGEPVKALRGLLTEMISGKNRLEREEGGTVELLMPGPDVLAALQGKPVGRYTATVETRWGLVKPGYLVNVETVVDGRGDHVWLLVEDRVDCTRPDCVVAKGTSWSCAVTTIRGRGIQHLDAFNPVAVRIPADEAVEL